MILAAALVESCVAPANIPEPDKPIIAHLFANPALYDGRPVTIYGLVIDADANGRRFLVQDVSQMPLRVVMERGLPVIAGDQILIEGAFKANRGDPYFEARKVVPTKVLGGGGCC